MLTLDVKKSIITALLLSVLIFPTFGGAETPVLLLASLLSLVYAILLPRNLSQINPYPVVIFIWLQLLITISLINDINMGISDIDDIKGSLRLVSMLFVYIGFSINIQRQKTPLFLDTFIVIATRILFVFLLTYFFGNPLSQLKQILYFSEEKFNGLAFISFFATSYFAVYFYYILFLYSICRVFYIKADLKWIINCLLALTLIFFSQGKTGYIAALLTIAILVSTKFRPLVNIIFITFFSTLLYLFNKYRLDIADYLLTFEYFPLRNAAYYMIRGLEEGSAKTRYEQIAFALSSSAEHYYLGAGLGNDYWLESWIAMFTYRYGFIGLIIYCLFFITSAIFSFKKMRKSKSSAFIFIYAFSTIWYINIPIIMLSSPMFEMGKNAIYSMLIVALTYSTSKMRIYKAENLSRI